MPFIAFVIVLSILILVHEWGHYITAKRCGVRVLEFALGFGPKLYRRMHDGTEFCLCLIPLGGYVKMAGDDRHECKGDSHEFFSKSVGARALIVLMGPVVNLVFAFFCFWLVFLIGFADLDLTAKRVPPMIGEVVKNAPAEKGGLQKGDKIISIDGKPIAHWPDLQDYVTTSSTPALTFVIERGGEQMTKSVVPNEQSQKDIFGREHKTRKIGVGPVQLQNAEDLVIVRYGFFESMAKAGEELVDITAKTYQALYEMILGVRSPKDAMGIVGMFFVIKFALSVSFTFLLHIVGVISLNLAIFNLLPVLPLDGGHLLLLAIEKIRKKALSIKWELAIAKTGFGLIIMLALFIFYVDFERIGLIDKIVNIFKPMG